MPHASARPVGLLGLLRPMQFLMILVACCLVSPMAMAQGDPCDTDPCYDESCPEYDPCECWGEGCL